MLYLYSKKALFLLKSSFLHPGINQTNQVCVNNNQGRVNQNCKYHDPEAGVLVLGRGRISH